MTTTLQALEDDQAEHARDLVAAALKRAGLTKAEMRAELQAGYGQAMSGGHPSAWPSETPRDRAVIAAGRLVLRLRDELFLPIQSVIGPSAISIATELLK
jgi:hypothetical protein